MGCTSGKQKILVVIGYQKLKILPVPGLWLNTSSSSNSVVFKWYARPCKISFSLVSLSLSPLHPHRTTWDSLHMSCPSRPVCPCSGFSWKVHPYFLCILSSHSLSQLKSYLFLEAFPKWVAPGFLLWRPLFASCLQLLDVVFLAYSSLYIFLSHAADGMLLKDSGLVFVFSDIQNSGGSMSSLLNKQMDGWLQLKLMILIWPLMVAKRGDNAEWVQESKCGASWPCADINIFLLWGLNTGILLQLSFFFF